MRCANCLRQVQEQARVCLYCGHHLDSPEPEPTGQQALGFDPEEEPPRPLPSPAMPADGYQEEAPPPEPASRWGRAAAVLAIAALVLAAVLVTALLALD